MAAERHPDLGFLQNDWDIIACHENGSGFCHVYGRSLQDVVNMVAALRERQIGFTSLYERLDTTTSGGRLIFHVFAALAEFIRELIVQGTNEGLAAARPRADSAASCAVAERCGMTCEGIRDGAVLHALSARSAID
ncbi:recombinase family protein [Streptomyces sp. SID3212]|uniref:recombinase family protein n=1 Tax=Streptomyces sp. SID3212 TaxID=2690259 RepID=UPI0031F656AD